MRVRFHIQQRLDVTPIEKLTFPSRSRDELPPVLRALQWIFLAQPIRDEVLLLLEQTLAKTPKNKSHTGRPGMDLWQILVLAVVRLALNCDYDRLEYLVNMDVGLRQIMGLPALCPGHELSFGVEDHPFSQKTISRNVCHLQEDVLRRINEIISQNGRDLFAKRKPGRVAPPMAIK